MIEDQIQINANVVDVKILEELGKKTAIFCIKINGKNGETSLVERVYSDFLRIRDILTYRWPGIYISFLTSKQKNGNINQDFLEKRKFYLNLFLTKIGEVPYLLNSKEFETFLKTNEPLSNIYFNVFFSCFNLKGQALSLYETQTLEELVLKYQKVFEELSGLEINTELIVKVTSFEKYLKETMKSLKNFRSISRNFANSRLKLNEDYEKFFKIIMPNYEESFLLDPSKFVFLDEKLREKFFFLEKELKSNPFIKFNCLLSQEIRELKAFSQIYEKKTYYESYRKKIMTKQKALQNEMQEALMGKTSLKSFFMISSKAQSLLDLEQNLSETNVELSGVSFICDVLLVILGYIEIDRFKRDKENNYYKLLKEISEKEFSFYRMIQEFWTDILNNPLLLPYKYE